MYNFVPWLFLARRGTTHATQKQTAFSLFECVSRSLLFPPLLLSCFRLVIYYANFHIMIKSTVIITEFGICLFLFLFFLRLVSFPGKNIDGFLIFSWNCVTCLFFFFFGKKERNLFWNIRSVNNIYKIC